MVITVVQQQCVIYIPQTCYDSIELDVLERFVSLCSSSELSSAISPSSSVGTEEKGVLGRDMGRDILQDQKGDKKVTTPTERRGQVYLELRHHRSPAYCS